MGGTFVAEEWPEQRRRMGAGLMHTGYYVGIFLAALANYGIGSHYGWRAMFIVGGVPALLLAWIPARGCGARGVEKEGKRGPILGGLASLRHAVFCRLAPPYPS